MEERIKLLLPAVEKQVYRLAFWVTRSVYKENFAREDMLHHIRVSLFEALHNKPEADNKTIIVDAVKLCKNRYTGVGSTHDALKKRNRASRTRALLAQDMISQSEFYDPHDIHMLGDIYKFLYTHCGHELAVIYILNQGYGVSPIKITSEILGVNKEENPREFYKQKQRIYRQLTYVSRVLKEGLNVSREGRELLNFQR